MATGTVDDAAVPAADAARLRTPAWYDAATIAYANGLWYAWSVGDADGSSWHAHAAAGLRLPISRHDAADATWYAYVIARHDGPAVYASNVAADDADSGRYCSAGTD